MSRNAIAGQLCGVFAIITILAAIWLGASTLWDARTIIISAIIDYPAATVFWVAAAGFVGSFIYGIKS
jgi:hypothetical protein